MIGLILPLSASAQILDISPDGKVQVYSGAVTATAQGKKPLIKPVKSRPAPVAAAIDSAARHHNLSQALIAAVAWQESHMRQDAISPKGARGAMQLMPATARALGVDAGALTQNVDGGAAYLAILLKQFDGDIIKSLAAYNAGPEAVIRYGGVPPFPETRAYVNAVLERLANTENLR